MARPANARRVEAGSMTELRRLVFGDADRRVAEALPRAVAIRAQRDRQLAIALEPLIADTLHDVAVRHPEKLADALHPIVGTAVRKAVTAAFAALLQRVNQALEHTFSIRSLRWRLEAARTGRPFAEIVLLHSLVFRVEQVFLIHRRTGLLLAHAAADPSEERDPDQIAAMLNVIEKFVHDAFREGETLTRFEVGDLQGRSEIGAEAAVTAVVRGTPPEDLSRVLREALDRIQLEYRDALLGFRGDTAPFATADNVLAGCLLERRVERRRSLLFPIAAGVIALVLLAFVGRAILHARDANRRLHEYASALRDQPGVVVTEATRDGDHFVLVGLRDPLAPEPAAILAARGLDPARATFNLQPFYSLDHRLVEPRVIAALSPPTSVELSFDRGVVRVTGIASREWLLRARVAGGVLPGVTFVDTSRAREREAIDDLRTARQRIEQTVFRFALRSSELDVSDEPRIDQLARESVVILRNATAAGVSARFRIEGFADPVGSTKDNRTLSRARAETLTAALVARGVPLAVLDARGAGEVSDVDPAHARRTIVHVVVEGAP
jgi:hypothetical protein